MAGPLFFDRVKDTSATTGTGTWTLANSPPVGSVAFSVVGDTNTCYYVAYSSDQSQWEVGLGTYSSTGPTLARTTVKSSSNSGSLVNFSSGPTLELVAAADFFSRANQWTSVAYSTTIPLDGIKYMPRQTVAAPITFTAGTTVAGGQCYLRLIADGTNVPTFSGMTQSSMSSGYNNTLSTDNQITFWYDGITVFYAVQQ